MEDPGSFRRRGRDLEAGAIALEDDADFGGEEGHGTGGPIPIARPPEAEWGPIDRALRDAALDLGYPWCADYHAAGCYGGTNGHLASARARSGLLADGRGWRDELPM